MSYKEKSKTLRDGKEHLFRSPREEDSAAMLELERALIRDNGRGMVKYEDELPSVTEHREQAKKKRTPGSLQIIVEREGALLGEVSINRFSLRMLKHVGLLALGVHPNAQGIGLGRALMEEAIAWAREQEGSDTLARIELYVRADNVRAIKLYKSMGFFVEGVRRNFIRKESGELLDDIVMGLLL